jgi:hypothetical protein
MENLPGTRIETRGYVRWLVGSFKRVAVSSIQLRNLPIAFRLPWCRISWEAWVAHGPHVKTIIDAGCLHRSRQFSAWCHMRTNTATPHGHVQPMIVPRLFRSRRLAITISVCQNEQLSNRSPEANFRKAELPKALHRWESLAGKTQRCHRVFARVVQAVATEAKSLGAFNPPFTGVPSFSPLRNIGAVRLLVRLQPQEFAAL